MVRRLERNELNNALPLIWNVFCEYEAVNYPKSGEQAFWNAIHSEEYLDMLTAYGAFDGGRLIGIIATRNAGSHIALFFVDEQHHRQGIGRSLWNKVLAETEADVITVNSSLFAQEIYRSLGFIETDDVQTEDGIKYVPMCYKR
jgi:predicted GNAT family N-acyltransferase